ncbi:RNA-binding S4 domain-containing protein [Sutterella massiliensis]|uniref:RNA-binding S4 domain-containing protein n=1 Tax=Sutterella massiliensis TaxID=1816689 RepID=A0ABS2DS39_9BURK|nr:RNA-binding S4 domain-containing protein [Sutterella massiliensis]MBM6704162.1 RNA-binding S4 domain-containing protein [Sutterella massiliensis]
MSQEEIFRIRGEYITLDALLKAAGVADSGGQAKEMILAGEVTVDGAVEERRGRKLRGGEVVVVDGRAIRIEPSA